MNTSRIPLIAHFSWGHIEVVVGEQTHRFKDCKLWPEGAAAWDWNESGTHHSPGIQPADVMSILTPGVEVVILSRGVLSRLGVCPETEALLQARHLEYHMLPTPQAVALYNDLARQGKKTAGLFHSTC